MRKFLLLIFALFFSLPAFAAGDVISVISDAQISSDKSKANSMTPSIQKLLNAVDRVNSDSTDYVVFLGDNVASSNRLDIAMFAKIADKIKKPLYVALGNRDVRKQSGIDSKEYFRILNKFSKNKTSKLPSYKKAGEYVFVFMYGVNESIPTYRGNYRNSELKFLDKTLTKFSKNKVIIFQHFPIIAPKEDIDRRPYNPDEYLKVLSKHDNVLALVSGHFHYENIQKVDGVYHISVGGLESHNEFEQLKIFKNADGTYSISPRVINISE